MSHFSKLIIRKEIEGIAVAIKWDKAAIKLAHEVEELEKEIKDALKIANELTLETQTIGEAVTELVRLVYQARAKRDELLKVSANFSPGNI